MLETWISKLDKHQQQQLQTVVNDVRTPSDVGTLGKKFVYNIGMLKASELRLFWYAVAPAVLGSKFLSDPERSMMLDFVEAIRLLDSPSVTERQLDTAHHLLGAFVGKFADIFGPERVTPNMHAHAHIAETCLPSHDRTRNAFILRK